MFGDLLRRLTAPAPLTRTSALLTDADARLALASLMVRIARTDGWYDDREARIISTRLAERYDLDDAGADALRRDAEILESEAPDTVRFTRAIKDAVAPEDREAVIEMLWSVVLADGDRDHEEDSQLRLITGLLGVKDIVSARARQASAARGNES